MHEDREYVVNGRICDTRGGYTYRYIYYIIQDGIRHYFTYVTGVREFCNPTFDYPEYMYEDLLSEFPIELCDVLRVFHNLNIQIEKENPIANGSRIVFIDGVQVNPFITYKFDSTEHLQKILLQNRKDNMKIYPYKFYKPGDVAELYSSGWGDGSYVTDKYIFQCIDISKL